jgi:DNA-nicking Smr family endonuclease
LSDDEKALWRKVTEKAEPLVQGQTLDPNVYLPEPKPKTVPRADRRTAIPQKQPPRPQPAHDLAPSLPDRLRQAPVQMDRKSFTRMKRGKLEPEGRIDLHGMTLDRAHPALLRFVLGAHASGKRLILVITGKGKSRDDGGPIPVRHGVLRHQVPQWLAQAPLRSVVLQIVPAHVSHGGGGAYYVYLRRHR